MPAVADAGNYADADGAQKGRTFTLPEGWIVEVKARKGGKTAGHTYKCYHNPTTGVRCYSTKEVLRHLDGQNIRMTVREARHCFRNPTLEERAEKNNKKEEERAENKVPVQIESSPEGLPSGWIKEIRCRVNASGQRKDVAPKGRTFTLPEGWIVEVKARKGGKTAGHTYKCYHNPTTGVRCYSMKEVLRHLDGQNIRTTIREARHCFRNPTLEERAEKNNKKEEERAENKVPVQIESSPEGLPSGWIKEIRCRVNASGQRKDVYYIDPARGYVFRSKKDVLRYLETGYVSKNVTRRKVKSNNMSSAIGSPSSNGGSCLFVDPVSCYSKSSKAAQTSASCPTISTMADLNKSSEHGHAEDMTEARVSDGILDPAQQVKPDSGDIFKSSHHVSSKPGGSIQVNPMARNPLAGRRFKKLAIRRPFKKKEANVDTKVEEWPDEPETRVDMDLSDQSSPSRHTVPNNHQLRLDGGKSKTNLDQTEGESSLERNKHSPAKNPSSTDKVNRRSKRVKLN